MTLLLCSLASGATTFSIGTNQDYASVSGALAAEGETASQPIEFVLFPDYSPSNEISINGYDQGLAFSVDVTIRSSDPAESRPFREVHAYDGANVTLVDLEIIPVASSYTDPMARGSGSSIHYAAMLVTEASSLIAERVTVQDLSNQMVVMATNGSIELRQCLFTGNTPPTGNTNPYEFKNYSIGIRADGGLYTLTMVDTVVENASGPAIAAYNDGGTLDLNITGGRIADVISETAGSAIFTYGPVDTTVSGLSIQNAENTAVKLGQGSHNWLDSKLENVNGAQGGAFHLADGGNLTLIDVGCRNCYGNSGGGLVYARGGTSLAVKGLEMIDGGGTVGGAIFAESAALSVKNSRFCKVIADNGPLITSSSQVISTNNVFRNLPIDTPIFGGQGGDLEAVNNTFVQNEGSILGGVFTDLDFINNAVVRNRELNVGEQASNLRLAYNLFYDNVDTDYGPGLEVGEGNQVNVDPGFAEAFLADQSDCEVDPTPAQGSALIDAGDPEILDNDGTRSDIGAFGGPGAEDTEVSWTPEEDSDLMLTGGCSGSQGFAAFLLALPLLGLNRKRRKWAEEEARG
jgi:hypothetical protein